MRASTLLALFGAIESAQAWITFKILFFHFSDSLCAQPTGRHMIDPADVAGRGWGRTYARWFAASRHHCHTFDEPFKSFRYTYNPKERNGVPKGADDTKDNPLFTNPDKDYPMNCVIRAYPDKNCNGREFYMLDQANNRANIDHCHPVVSSWEGSIEAARDVMSVMLECEEGVQEDVRPFPHWGPAPSEIAGPQESLLTIVAFLPSSAGNGTQPTEVPLIWRTSDLPTATSSSVRASQSTLTISALRFPQATSVAHAESLLSNDAGGPEVPEATNLPPLLYPISDDAGGPELPNATYFPGLLKPTSNDAGGLAVPEATSTPELLRAKWHENKSVSVSFRA